MDKRVKWGIIILVGAGLIGLGIHNFTPKENEELNEASPTIKTNKKKSLNVNAQIIYNPQIEMFARFKTKSSFHKTKRII